jgi:hypothetical protein
MSMERRLIGFGVDDLAKKDSREENNAATCSRHFIQDSAKVAFAGANGIGRKDQTNDEEKSRILERLISYILA